MKQMKVWKSHYQVLISLPWARYYVYHMIISDMHIPWSNKKKTLVHNSQTLLGAIVKYSSHYVSIQDLDTRHLSTGMIMKLTTAEQ